LHLSNFWIPNRVSQGLSLSGEIDLYAKMRDTFSGHEPIVIATILIYVLGCASLGFNLAHGFQSAFKTLGVHNKRYHQVL
ncbi:hypothetical protein ABTK74_20460, partial [Acinetobacter baumannii]